MRTILNKRGGYARNAREMVEERKERICKNHTIPTKLKFKCLQHMRVDEWSPEQISGIMMLAGKKIIHTTIYKWMK